MELSKMVPDNIPLSDIQDAKCRMEGQIMKTPLVPLNYDVKHGKVYLKLENLQPIGSFKLRGACNAIQQISTEKLKASGVYTTSAGNFAQGLAWNTNKLNIPCDVLVPDHAPKAKLEAIERLNGQVHKVTFDVWWKALQDHNYEGMKGVFIHPVSDKSVIAGNGTIGLEIFDDLPDIDAVIIPFGGGGLTCGIGSALKALKPNIKVYTCEVDTAAPLKASLDLGKPTTCNYQPSFIDGMGGKSVLPEMWPLIQNIVTDSLVVTVQEVANAVKLLAEKNHVIAEGAGAAAVAAALSGKVEGNIVCIISGGNLDTDKLIQILQGQIPT